MTSLNKIIYTDRFVKDAKSFVKKHHTFRQTLEELEKQLIESPRSGEPYGSKIYKEASIKKEDVIRMLKQCGLL